MPSKIRKPTSFHWGSYYTEIEDEKHETESGDPPGAELPHPRDVWSRKANRIVEKLCLDPAQRDALVRRASAAP